MTAYRIIADENVEPGTRRYLRQLGRDLQPVVGVDGEQPAVERDEIISIVRFPCAASAAAVP